MSRNEITMRFLLNALKQPGLAYGYDFWLPNTVERGTLLWNCAIEILKSEPPAPYVPPNTGMTRHMVYGEDRRENKVAAEIYPLAADILWLLCLQGILRPGVRQYDGQAVSSGQGYSLTIKGSEWMKNSSEKNVQELLAIL